MPQNAASVRHVLVTRSEQGQRVDNFLLKTLKGVPRSHVYRLVRTGQVRVNGGRVRPHTRLSAGDEVRVPPWRGPQPGRTVAVPSQLRARLAQAVVYEDANWLVLNKPSGLAVHGGSGLNFGLIEAVRQWRSEAGSWELAHRLDRETSGCLLIAKERSALRAFHGALREGRVHKEYNALLIGAWRGGAQDVERALVKNRLRGGERMVERAPEGERGLAARSRFVPQRVWPQASLVTVCIATGRTHQIRVHAAGLGMPVAGDDKYGDRGANRDMRALGLKRLFLHARRLAFDLPPAVGALDVTAPLPSDLEAVLAALERRCG